MRGEYVDRDRGSMRRGELPPRARRIPLFPVLLRNIRGTTSACAENTLVHAGHDCDFGNYLRVRGEYPTIWIDVVPRAELPPRARRIPGQVATCASVGGTTSACAENTASPHRTPPTQWNYLRVRGEYWCTPGRWRSLTELPPRARRILVSDAFSLSSVGTTSACAENTPATTSATRVPGNYLRVRGEY